MFLGLRNEYHSLDQINKILLLSHKNNADFKESMYVATQLVNHGMDSAYDYIYKLKKIFPFAAVQEYLAGLDNRLSNILNLENLASIWNDKESVQELYKTSGYVLRIGSFRKNVAVVIFTSKFNNFHLSNLVIDALLSDLGVTRLFVKDTSDSIYFRGVEGLSSSLVDLPTAINSVLEKLNCNQMIITGFSSGGYAALYTASKLKNIGFIGLSTHTNLSFDSHLPRLKLHYDLHGHVPNECFLDFRKAIQESDYDNNYHLIYGERDLEYKLHANHLRGLINVNIDCVINSGHQVTSSLMERGLLKVPFEKILNRNVVQDSK